MHAGFFGLATNMLMSIRSQRVVTIFPEYIPSETVHSVLTPSTRLSVSVIVLSVPFGLFWVRLRGRIITHSDEVLVLQFDNHWFSTYWFKHTWMSLFSIGESCSLVVRWFNRRALSVSGHSVSVVKLLELRCIVYYCVSFAWLIRFVTRWGGPGGIEAYP